MAKVLEKTAIRAAHSGARIIRRYYETGLKARFKSDVNLVTKADVESQKAIVAILRRAFPKHAILAEESERGHKQSLDGPIWIVDPLDGTTNYAHGFPVFGISIAFRDEGKTRFGLVYQPLLDELYIAHLGGGATRNGKPIRVSKIGELSKSLLATGFPYDRRTARDNNLNHFCYFEMVSQCVRRAGAATIDLAHIACGRFDGFWEPKLAPWDIAAGILLVEEAGGTVTDYQGAPITDLWCNEIVASNGKIHEKMLEGIRRVKSQSVGLDSKRLAIRISK